MGDTVKGKEGKLRERIKREEDDGGVCYENLVRAFYSNAKFDYGSNGQTIASSPHMLWEKRLKFLPLSLRNTSVFPTRVM
ncbi:hypothetical protein Gohar_004341, partial [Gossypium harknessii]|nr:hypothetical protein [Gossypium harknessii]